ncbi:MAG TPA: zf-HC2 domain-containing protein [Gemmatimonadaceae bacterium]|nr:zf-HC2 domain-containing protein [Gemmatimonadaceae bacterium]
MTPVMRSAPPTIDATPLDPTCALAQRRLWEYLDGELTASESLETGKHFDSCPRCGSHAVFARRLLDRIAAIRPRQPAVAGLKERIARLVTGSPLDEEHG